MPLDLQGPSSNTPNVVTTQPSDTRVFGASDTFFKDCSSPSANDGTPVSAGWLNGVLQQLRRAIRGMGVTEDNADDDMLLKAIQSAQRQHGQCYVSVSGGNVVLSRRDGNSLMINGVRQIIPSAGVTLAPSGLIAGSLYYIYATILSGAMALEASATGHITDIATGVEVKSGDVSRTLVGMVSVVAGPAFDAFLCLSWFNRHNRSARASLPSATSTTAITFIKISTSLDINFLTWGDEDVMLRSNGTATAAALSGVNTCLAIDNTDALPEGVHAISPSAGAGEPVAIIAYRRLSEGLHTLSLVGCGQGGSTVTWVGDTWSGGPAPSTFGVPITTAVMVRG